MKVAVKDIEARRYRLAGLLQEHRFLPIAELCERLNISEATARRDLAALERERKITRTYGGAMSSFDQQFASFRDRQIKAPVGKRSIALQAHSFLRPKMTCFLDVGTTLYALAEILRERLVDGLTIVTNSLPIAEMLSPLRGYAVHMLGGQLFHRQSLLLGGTSLATLKLWKFDCAFLGAEGVTAEGLWNSHPDVINFQRAVLQRTSKLYLCLDAQKFGNKTEYLLINWKAKFSLITDASQDLFEKLEIHPKKDQVIHT